MHSMPNDLLRREKNRDELAIQRHLGTELRACLDSALVAPMPEKVRRLLRELDVEAPRLGSGAGCSKAPGPCGGK